MDEEEWEKTRGEEAALYARYRQLAAQLRRGLARLQRCLAKLEETQPPCLQEVWRTRRRGQCLMAWGQYAEAEELLLPLARQQRQWFFWHDLAQLYERQQRWEEALSAAATAALAPGRDELKRPLFQLLARLYRRLGREELAQAQEQLLAALRQAAGHRARGEPAVSPTEGLLCLLRRSWRQDQRMG